MFEYFFPWPYCNAEISMLLDPSIRKRQYIEDCEVCCNPIDVLYSIEEGEVMEFNAVSIEQ